MDLDKLKSEIIKYQKDFEDEFNESKKDFNEFLRLYPFKENPKKIDSLTKDDIFKKGHSSFLYYIEFKLKSFGRIRLGSAKYAYNARDQIDYLKILLKIAVEDSLPISKKLDAPWDKIPYWKGDRQIAKKIIYCYNPNKVMPIYNTAHLEHFASLFNENYDSQANKFKKHYVDLTLGEKFEYLNEIILEFKKENIPHEIDNVIFMRFLYEFYPPGSSIQIESFLKYVFKYYNGLKEHKKPVANSKASKVFRNFADDLKNYSEHILEKPKNVLSSKAIYHAGGTWVNSPYVWLDDLELKNNKFNVPPFFVRYSFESEMQNVHLMLKVNWGYAKHYLEDIKGKFDEEDRNNFFKSKSEELRKKLIRAKKLPEDSYNYSNPSIIYSKSYEKNNLPSEEELKSDLIKILNLYGDLVELDSFETLSQFLEIILKNYNKTREDKVSAEEKASIRDFLATKLPEKLSDITQSKYKTFSSAWDKMQYCPYVALMNEEITIKHNEGFFVNYMFREDMSGVYLALRQGINNIYQSNYKEKLIAKSEGYRQTQSDNQISKFSEEIDLKSAKGAYSEFYEAGNIYAKFYPADNLPSEEEMLIDLEKMLEIYDYLSEIKTIEYPSFNEYLKDKNFLYTPEMLENYLLSLKVKPFVILTGNSGTGKTKIAQLFAEYLEHENEGESVIIPVGANWTENRHLMGFFNVITSDYQSTPALDLIIKASNDNSKPYFLILDEMNLSHVERYFSDFLSAMESGKEISLYSEDNARIIKNKLIPEKLEIPNNLFVIGTVNVDETTYMFSPKVLDRANTIEFKTYPARDFIMCEIEHKSPEGNINYLENPISDLKMRKCKINDLKDKLAHVKVNANDNLWEELALEIHSFQEVLSEAGFDFGFRVIDEIMRFMYAAWLYEDSPDEWKNWTRYFDAQIMQKMLPKIHGSQQELSQVLENLFELCYSGESIDKIWYSANLEEYEIKYASSAKKLQKMGKKLHEKRFVSFTD